MVKGVSRRVVVVRPKNGAAFEQAIFVVKDEGGGKDVLREACAVAESYLNPTLHRRPSRRYTRLQMCFSAVSGALLTGLVWLLTLMLLP